MPRPNNVGVGVGVIVFNDLGCVLMGLRKGAHASETWSFPGGWMDYTDRSVEDTGWRELMEETDLFTEEDENDLKVFAVSSEAFPEQDPPFRTVTVYVKSDTVVLGAPHVTVQEPNKCYAWAWVDPRSSNFGPVFAGIPQIWDQVIEESTRLRVERNGR